MRAFITQKLVDSTRKRAKAGEILKPLEIRDEDLKGFILRAQPSGHLAYIVQYARGKRLTLGDAAVLTPTQARNRAKAVLGAVAEGRDPLDAIRQAKSATAPTLREYLEDTYVEWVTVNRRSGAAQVARLKACFFTQFGETPLDQLAPLDLENWRKRRLQQGRAVGTVNRDLNTLKSALSRALDWGIIAAHPLAKLKPGREDQNGVVRYLSGEEERRLRQALAERDTELKAARERTNEWRRLRHKDPLPGILSYGDHLTPMVLVSLHTGLRRGELFNLQWPDVDLERALLTVRGSGAKSQQTRHVPLNAEALAALQAWQKQTGATSGYVFAGRGGGRFDNTRKSWLALLEAAGIEGFRWHDMRHTFASKLVMAGVDLNTVRELLGHSDLSMTLRYAHLAPEHKAAAVARLVEVGNETGGVRA
ncbi:MAG: site-specific integrase [Chromatiales bacterium]|nr:site-specific integrase [Chromatiales bacterium]